MIAALRRVRTRSLEYTASRGGPGQVFGDGGDLPLAER
jgi:hypothetical protein